jgi:hypothetical protein
MPSEAEVEAGEAALAEIWGVGQSDFMLRREAKVVLAAAERARGGARSEFEIHGGYHFLKVRVAPELVEQTRDWIECARFKFEPAGDGSAILTVEKKEARTEPTQVPKHETEQPLSDTAAILWEAGKRASEPETGREQPQDKEARNMAEVEEVQVSDEARLPWEATHAAYTALLGKAEAEFVEMNHTANFDEQINRAKTILLAALPHLEPAIRADEREKAAERIEAKRRPMVFREHPHRAWYEGQNRAIDAALAALKGEHEDS